ncbi:glycosyltransferase family 8 protein [Helicobacter sp. MIT 14-3879]|uniref:glycosyltransferase family 8 protein n=1 Tax=Helicobacter sp. MIT 14-3879 TaxID=2040649 RepID=UPI000E1E6696|nr:glycosyltransferase family 8 protein [Helicobacter sp. MIT 14-3879]RDU65197.1 lipopolysaccharide biosynthesis protein [Helicobacter sp. MIT 14-3879]
MQKEYQLKEITIPIMFCFDKNYAIPASVAFYSLLKNANRFYEVDSTYGGG